MRLDYGTDGIFSVWSRGLKTINNKGDIVRPTAEDVYTVITWLDDSGNEYLPKYKPNALRKNNEWKSVQELKLSTYIRTSSTWNDVGTEQVATIGHAGKGQTRRRQGGEWKQERPFS